MKTLTTTIVLSVMFLSAGAFARSPHGLHEAVAVPAEHPANVTVVTKNAAWPLPGQISVEACSRNKCLEI